MRCFLLAVELAQVASQVGMLGDGPRGKARAVVLAALQVGRPHRIARWGSPEGYVDWLWRLEQVL